MEEKEKKRIRVKSYSIGFITGFVTFMLILCFLQPSNPLEIFTVNFLFNYLSMANEGDDFVKDVVDKCIPIMELSERHAVDCVVSEVSQYYKYDNRNTSIFKRNVRTPSEFKEKGGVCRDIAVAYDLIFRNLGFKTSYIYEKYDNTTHIYNHIYTNDISCTVDGNIIRCI